MPLSLTSLTLYSGYFLQDIFYAIEQSKDFDELTAKIRNIVDEDIAINKISENYIRYIVTDHSGNRNYLKIRITGGKINE